jgi:(p)ppGpp synthase/HD superfamily hydrolase
MNQSFDWTRYQEALTWATLEHGDQKYGQLPYVHHLLAVERQLSIHCFHPLTPEPLRKLPLKRCEDLLIACLLHDIVEDTKITIEDVREKFGERVADMVFAVTNEEGETRKERFANVYPKIRSTRDAVIVKLCDRIANFESCLEFRLTKDRPRVLRLFRMYQKEHPSFKEELQRGDQKHLRRMWDRLESLAARNPEGE